MEGGGEEEEKHFTVLSFDLLEYAGHFVPNQMSLQLSNGLKFK